MKCGIYVIQNKITGDCYFGQSVNVYKRLNGHLVCLTQGHHDNSRLLHAFSKYGRDNFIFAVILYCEQSELTHYEQLCVDTFQSTYNLSRECVNSRKGMKSSEETKRKLREAWKHRKVRSPSEETRRKIAAAGMGRKLSDEARRKVSAAMIGNTHTKGRKLSDAHKAKIANVWKGRKHTDEARMRLRESHLGHVMSDQCKEKLRIRMQGNQYAVGHIPSAEAIAQRLETKRKNRLKNVE